MTKEMGGVRNFMSQKVNQTVFRCVTLIIAAC